ncbi:MAG: methyltransferase [Elusimicrobiota bacterium]|jgi:precorrin-6B methylase 2
MIESKFKIDNDTELSLHAEGDVFLPTGTSLALLKGVRKRTVRAGVCLDLGCGTGVVGIALSRFGLVQPPLYASDYHADAVESTRLNCGRHDCPVVARQGSLFEPWKDCRFDYIVDDVSGVAEAIARVSPWFKNIPCASGKDGAELVLQVIRQAPRHLRPGGKLFFPVISLSNVKRILSAARERFPTVERLVHEEWPLPPDMHEHLDLLKRLREEGVVTFEEKFGMTICFTDIYVASGETNSKGD